MKTFSTDGRIPLSVILPDDPDAEFPEPPAADPAETPEEQAWRADTTEALTAAWTQPRYVSLPGREPTDLESISDLWLD